MTYKLTNRYTHHSEYFIDRTEVLDYLSIVTTKFWTKEDFILYKFNKYNNTWELYQIESEV